jgi:hypothetical protein
MKKAITAILVVSMLLCGSLTVTADATTGTSGTGEMPIEMSFIGFEPFASEHLRSWSPLLSRTQYGASINFNGTYSGTAVVELHDRAGRIASFSHSFTNRTSIAPVTSRTTAAGTYRIVIKVTISSTTTERESHWMGLS